MRRILSISLPEETFKSLQKRAKKAGKTPGIYIRQIILEEEKMITEEELLERAREAQENYRAGNVTVLENDEDIAKFFASRSAK